MNEQSSNLSAFKKGLRTGIPICLGYYAVAFALGITAKQVGMSAFQSGIMSFFMLASAGEFAAVSLIAAAAGPLEMIFTTIVVNMRYLLMGSALSQKINEKTPLIHRFLLSYCITDELFGVSVSVSGKLNPFFTYGAAIIAAAGWTAGTVCGVLIGNILPFWAVDALSVALYGMFLAVIIPASKKDFFIAKVVLVSMAASYLFSITPLLKDISSGFRVIILTLIIAGGAALIRPVDDTTEDTIAESADNRKGEHA